MYKDYTGRAAIDRGERVRTAAPKTTFSSAANLCSASFAFFSCSSIDMLLNESTRQLTRRETPKWLVCELPPKQKPPSEPKLGETQRVSLSSEDASSVFARSHERASCASPASGSTAPHSSRPLAPRTAEAKQLLALRTNARRGYRQNARLRLYCSASMRSCRAMLGTAVEDLRCVSVKASR